MKAKKWLLRVLCGIGGYHPIMEPFDALSDQERAKDDDAWQLLDAIAKALK